MTRTALRRQFDADHAALHAMWHEWDPIGVADDPARDQYDCQIVPVLRLLHDGAGELTIAAHLQSELPEHFGVDADRHEAFARRVAEWWHASRPSS